ncbi:hypothetical protein Tco_1398983 [Tanacetum coccineum]
MASFPCLEGLAVAANSRSLFDKMMLYFERETLIDFDFAADLHNLWVQFTDQTNDRKLFISELDGLPPSVMSYNCCQFLRQVQDNDFIKLLELRKMIAETYHEIRMIPVRLYLLLYYVHGDDEVGTWKIWHIRACTSQINHQGSRPDTTYPGHLIRRIHWSKVKDLHLMQSTINDPKVNAINDPSEHSNHTLNAINERRPYFKETPSIRRIDCIEYGVLTHFQTL